MYGTGIFYDTGAGFFYGGLVRRKNVVNTMLACTFIMGLSVVMWILFGYSLSFGGNHAGIIGDFRWFGLNGIGMGDAGPYAPTIPHFVYIAFQMMFAMITPALITGSLVGRVKFKALFIFILLWSIVVYYPMAHMVWGEGGLLAELGSVDFAGGNVVHISSGVSALVLQLYLEEEKDMSIQHIVYTTYLLLRLELLFSGLAGLDSMQEVLLRLTDLRHMLSLPQQYQAPAQCFHGCLLMW